MTDMHAASEADLHNERILLVDDNPTNLQVLLHTLNGQGYKLLIAKNGESALKIARKALPALVLLDIMMPGIDGYEVCRQLKADPETANITVIFLSALDDTKDKVRGLETGAVDFISKPFQAEEVIARVETQLKIHRLERALSERNRQLEAHNERLLTSMREGIFGLDLNGQITFANPAASQITGWSENQLIGQNLFSKLLHCEEGDERSQTPVAQVLSAGDNATIEDGLFWRAGGQAFPVDYSCTPVREQDAISGAVLVFRDITEKKRQQEALQQALDELKEQQQKLTHVSRLSIMGEMAAGIAHEVNQPLTAISNYAQVCNRMLARDEPPMDSVQEALDKIGVQARRAGEVIARIRRFVKKPEHIDELIDPNKLITDVVRLAEVDAKNNSMEIKLDLADTLPVVQVDPVQIQQVALNLVRNAMEAMRDEPTRALGVLVKTEQLDREYVRISVIDRGHGLAADAAEKLFTPFYTTKSNGMGIGLSICHSIIQTHGGRLTFEHNPEGGTIFRFTLPIA